MKIIEQMAEAAGIGYVEHGAIVLLPSETGDSRVALQRFAAMVAERCAQIAANRQTGVGAAFAIRTEFPKP